MSREEPEAGPNNKGECYGCRHNLVSHGGFSCHHPLREYERLPWDNHTPSRCPQLKLIRKRSPERRASDGMQ